MNKYNPVKTVTVPVNLPRDRSSLKKYTKEKSTYLVGRVIHSNGTRIGSFKDK